MPDVAIIGGSAAGLLTAELLAKKRARVRLFDRQLPIAPAKRTLIVTHQMLDLLGGRCEGWVVNEIQRFEIIAGDHVVTIPLESPDLIIERASVVHALTARAVDEGVEIKAGERLVGLEPGVDGVTAVFEKRGRQVDERVPVEIAIGADGAFSRVAHLAGWPKQPTVPLLQAVVALPPGTDPGTARVWFDRSETPFFYWLIPESASTAAVGLIGENGTEIRGSLARFLTKHGLAASEYQGGRIPRYDKWISPHKKLGGGDVYLVGDAGGQAKVTTVGGMVTGFKGALAVAAAITNGGGRAEFRALRRELDLHLWVRKALQGLDQAGYVALLAYLSRSSTEILGRHTRDEMPKLLTKLLLRQPRLLVQGLRSLVFNGASSGR